MKKIIPVSIIGAMLLSFILLILLNAFFDTYHFVYHSPIAFKINLYMPIKLLKRQNVIVSAYKVKKTNIVSPIPQNLNIIPKEYEYVRTKVLLAVKEKWGDNENIQAIDNLIFHESGYNPLALNPSSGAGGIFQALPFSKTNCEFLDIDCQIRWGLQYIESSYNNPVEAWNFWLSRRPVNGKDLGNWY